MMQREARLTNERSPCFVMQSFMPGIERVKSSAMPSAIDKQVALRGGIRQGF
jgi:hypothetical protein